MAVQCFVTLLSQNLLVNKVSSLMYFLNLMGIAEYGYLTNGFSFFRLILLLFSFRKLKIAAHKAGAIAQVCWHIDNYIIRFKFGHDIIEI